VPLLPARARYPSMSPGTCYRAFLLLVIAGALCVAVWACRP
jgi:hypothetical protein